jgi:hypothetical protein
MESPLFEACLRFRSHLEKQLLEVLRMKNFNGGLPGFIGDTHNLHERLQAQENLVQLVGALQDLHQKMNKPEEKTSITADELHATASRLLAKDPPANFIDKNGALYFSMARFHIISELAKLAAENNIRSFYTLYNANGHIIKKSEDEATRDFTKTVSRIISTSYNRNSFMNAPPAEAVVTERQPAKKSRLG